MLAPNEAATALAGHELVGSASLSGLCVIGHALDPASPDLGLVVELLVDGLPLQVARADLFDRALAADGAANPFHGFAFNLPQSVFWSGSWVEVRVANDGARVGSPLMLDVPPQDGAGLEAAGFVAWHGGLRFGGWTAFPHFGQIRLRGLVDEDVVVEAQSAGWTIVRSNGAERSLPSFEFHLPERFADGRVHRIELLTADGELVPPGPLTFVAFEDGLERFLAAHADVASERLRGEAYDRLMPQSLPLSAIEGWRLRFPVGPPARLAAAAQIAVALIGEADFETSLDSLGDQSVGWTAGILPLDPGAATFGPADLIAFLDGEAAGCDVVAFAMSGTVFLNEALSTLAAALVHGEGGACAYADVIAELGDGRRLPLGLPAIDQERMLEQGFGAWCFVLTRDAVMRAARAGANSLFGLFNSAVRSGPDAPPLPAHVPGFLAIIPPVDVKASTRALARASRDFCDLQGIDAQIEPGPFAQHFPAVRVRRVQPACSVSVIVAVREGPDALRRCLTALKAQKTGHGIDLTIIHQGSSSDAGRADLEEIAGDHVRVLLEPGHRNAAKLFNRGAAEATGDLICFVDQNVALSGRDAINELVGRFADPQVAVVGGMLAWPNGVVRDGGLVVNFREGATRAFAGHAAGDPGYAEMLGAARETTAVSGELMMVRREHFAAVGGMDEAVFPIVFHAVAFCLEARAAGFRIVSTPHAKGIWTGPADGIERQAELGDRLERELFQLRSRWAEQINDDLFYSPLLALNGPLYSALAWPPRDMRPRRPLSAPLLAARPATSRSWSHIRSDDGASPVHSTESTRD